MIHNEQNLNHGWKAEDLEPVEKAFGFISIAESGPKSVSFAVRAGVNGGDIVPNPEIKPIKGFDISQTGSLLTVTKKEPAKAAKPAKTAKKKDSSSVNDSSDENQ